jgi:hypothetical protein
MAAVGLLTAGGCRNDDPATTTGARPAGTGTGPAATGDTPAPTLTGDAELACLTGGSPWHISKPDLETQTRGLMRGINVTDVHIVGDQTLTVTDGPSATFTDTTTTRITAAMGNGLTMVVTQKHSGSSAGGWTVDGNTLTPDGAWAGQIKVDTKVAINGRTANSPVTMPTDTLGNVVMHYTCADGSLNLTAQGSPIVYLFR